MASNVDSVGESQTPYYLSKSGVCIDEKGGRPGNGAFASQAFQVGAPIFALKRPLVGILDTKRLSDTCANCYVGVEGTPHASTSSPNENIQVSACVGCKYFRYCGKVCQKKAWQRVHKHECKILKDLGGRALPPAVQATMEILIRRKFGLMTDKQWQMLCNLDSHIMEFKQSGKYNDIRLMAMGALNFSRTQDAYNIDFVEQMYTRVLTNSLTLVSPTYDPIGLIMDEKIANINHSCYPNAYVVMDGPEVSVRGLRPIQKDEEIYISYIDVTLPYARRQAELKDHWFFVCRCTKCQNGNESSEDMWAIDPHELSPEWRQKGEALLTKEFASDPVNYVGDSEDEKIVAALQGQAFERYQAEQKMLGAEAIKSIEACMKDCHSSRLWPVHRQPYAALRDDLIVNLLSEKEFLNAWAHCAKRYRDILPKLYPQVAHPIRVVQVWQTAMLAMYLAGEKESVMDGADMCIIGLILIKEVYELCPLSHGETSSFSKSVRRKYEEVLGSLGPGVKLTDHQMKQQRKMLLKMADSVEY